MSGKVQRHSGKRAPGGKEMALRGVENNYVNQPQTVIDQFSELLELHRKSVIVSTAQITLIFARV